MKKKAFYITGFFLLGFLLVMPLWNLIVPVRSDSLSHENRTAAKPPVLKWNHPDSLSLTFEPWYQDHFPYRNLLLNSRMELDINVLKQTPLPDYVIIGKERWLFNTGNEIALYRGVNRFTDTQLQHWVEGWKQRIKFIESHHAKIVFAIIPVKYSIYPEYLPLNLKRVNPESRTDQVIHAMQEAGIPVLDLRNTLLKAKNDGYPLFFKSDNHWNYNGGFIAYQEVMAAIHNIYPEAGRVLDRKDFTIKEATRESGNLGKMLYIRDACGDLDYFYSKKGPHTATVDTVEKYVPPKGFSLVEAYEERYKIKKENAPKLLIIRDSFGHYILHFLKEHFRETVSIFDAWEYKLNADIIEKEKPDLVLFLIQESYLDAVLSHMDSESIIKQR